MQTKKTDPHKNLQEHASLYTLATILEQIITIIATLLVRRFLGPVQTGIWSTMQLMLKYLSYGSLGMGAAVHREVAFYQAKNDLKRAEDIKNVFLSYQLIYSIVIASAFILYAGIRNRYLEPQIFWALLLGAIYLLVLNMNKSLIIIMRAYRAFSLASKQIIASSIFNSICVAVLSYYFQIYGFALGMILSYAFNALFILNRVHLKFKLLINFRIMKELVQYGFPILLIGLANTIYLTVDQIFIVTFLGLEAMGLYNIAILAYRLVGNLPNAASNVMIPYFQEKHGMDPEGKALKREVFKSAEFFQWLAPPFIMTGWILCDEAIAILLPEFKGSIPSVKILLLASYFYVLNYPFATYIVTIRKQFTMLLITILTILLAIVINAIAIQKGWNLVGIAYGTLFLSYLRYAICQYYTFLSNQMKSEWCYRHIQTVIIFMIVAAMGWVMQSCESMWSGFQLLAPWMLYILLLTGYFYRLNQRWGVMQVIKKVATARFQKKTT